MRFQVTGKVEKLLWQGGDSFMYKIIENQGEHSKGWAVFTKEQLNVNDTYNIEGYVSESKDKKRVTSENKPIYITGFNAEKVILEMPF